MVRFSILALIPLGRLSSLVVQRSQLHRCSRLFCSVLCAPESARRPHWRGGRSRRRARCLTSRSRMRLSATFTRQRSTVRFTQVFEVNDEVLTWVAKSGPSTLEEHLANCDARLNHTLIPDAPSPLTLANLNFAPNVKVGLDYSLDLVEHADTVRTGHLLHEQNEQHRRGFGLADLPVWEAKHYWRV